MKKFSLFHKLIVSNILYAIPVIALVVLMMQAKNVNIEFGQMELKGDVYQKSLENLFQFVGEAKMNLDKDLNKDLLSQHLQSLKETQEKYGVDLQFTEEGLSKRKRENVAVQKVTDRLSDFANNYRSLSDEKKLEAYSQFISDIKTMITHVGDTSNLILDPDLDSYYLMDITLLALPQNQDRIHTIVSYIQNLVKNNTWTEKEKQEIGIYAALLQQSDIDRINADLQTVIQEDPNFYGVSPTLKTDLEKSLTDYTAKAAAFAKSLNDLSGAETLESAPAVISLGKETFAHAFKAWHAAVKEEDILITKRVDFLIKDKFQSLAFALSALIFAFGILFGVAKGFNSNMKSIIDQLLVAVKNTKEAGEELVGVSDTLSSGTNSQAAAIQQTAAAVDQINSMIQATLSNSSSAEQNANDSFQSTQQGHSAVADLYKAINALSSGNNSILDSVQNSDAKMQQITRIISEIEAKTKVINDIVFQTKLLSFNASVEAARAGEQGKGFSVVAEEVGNLAEMSGHASTEITNILHESIKYVNQISTDMREEVRVQVQNGKEAMSEGQTLAEKCKDSLDEILKRVDVLKSVVISINTAATEQARGIDEISKAIRDLDRVTQQNSVMSQQTAAYSKTLSEQAESLSHIVQIVECEVLGKAS